MVEQTTSAGVNLTFDPGNLKVNKRHTKILGTLNKKTTDAMLTDYIHAGMDGIRVFCDDGYDTCKRLIHTAREAARETSRRIVISIELMCKSTFSKF
jgi:pyruvate kinase